MNGCTEKKANKHYACNRECQTDEQEKNEKREGKVLKKLIETMWYLIFSCVRALNKWIYPFDN